MAHPQPPAVIELPVTIAARPETVFRFFSDPDRYKQWMGAESTIDPKLNGSLRVKFGPGPTAIGKIVEWVANEMLVFTWGQEGPGATLPRDSSRVTVTLIPVGEGTQVTLRHEGLQGDAERAGTAGGWRYYLSALAGAAVTERIGDAAERAVDLYIAAWNETDSAARDALLARCLAKESRFRDRYGCIDGGDNLMAYIGGAQVLLRGARLERTGPIERSYNYLRYGWRIARPDGSVLGSGENILELDPDNHIRLAVGFWTGP